MSRRSSQCRIAGMCRQEIGDLPPRIFADSVRASEDMVLRLGIHKKLEKHRGCVNNISFNANGNILMSGSDDEMMVLWDWEAGIAKLAFHSGHSKNVFHSLFMPYTDDKTIVTCAADGEVRHAQILDGGQVYTQMLAKHEGRAHRIAIEPGNPHIFYSCGGDGVVQHFDLRAKSATKLFRCKPFEDKLDSVPVILLNVIVVDPRNHNLIAAGGTDAYARLYDIRKYKWDGSNSWGHPFDCFSPPHIIGDDAVAITGLAFSDRTELLASYNDELIYLFSMNQGLGPNPLARYLSSGLGPSIESNVLPEGVQAYMGHRNHDTLKGVEFLGPHCEYVASGSDCGRIFIWRKRGGQLLRVMPGDKHIVNCVVPHPHANVLASSGIDYDVKIWSPNAVEPSQPLCLDEVVTPVGYGYPAIGSYEDENDSDDYVIDSGGGTNGSNYCDDEDSNSCEEYCDDGNYVDVCDVGDGKQLTQQKRRRLCISPP